ncbi:hypothetical protein ABE427_07290 [Acinetobacter higginsii]|uniref:hypothetical protein n=1 Tax=Acinetobacter higginsii TaxID=70347 RepID=UPI00300BDCBC
MKQLADSVYQDVMVLCKQGDKQVAEGQFEEAKDSYLDALLLLPSNHQEWETAT